jgi:hypothetical protein
LRAVLLRLRFPIFRTEVSPASGLLRILESRDPPGRGLLAELRIVASPGELIDTTAIAPKAMGGRAELAVRCAGRLFASRIGPSSPER